MIEIKLTPNRPDATAVTALPATLLPPASARSSAGTVEPVAGTGRDAGQGKLDFGPTPSLCRGFALRLVRGVNNGPSPKWLQQRLIAIGLRPINALVDITNYITFDRGRPLHVFDAAKVARRPGVRRAAAGETVLALDGRNSADAGDVRDRRCHGVEFIAGIMGGEHSRAAMRRHPTC